ncbi:hypothetical protein IWX50DRAFT_619800 [Phyllosticta citricarpa]
MTIGKFSVVSLLACLLACLPACLPACLGMDGCSKGKEPFSAPQLSPAQPSANRPQRACALVTSERAATERFVTSLIRAIATIFRRSHIVSRLIALWNALLTYLPPSKRSETGCTSFIIILSVKAPRNGGRQTPADWRAGQHSTSEEQESSKDPWTAIAMRSRSTDGGGSAGFGRRERKPSVPLG